MNRAEIISDLGQVQYMLIDKTGTLTDGDFRIDSIRVGDD